MYTSVSKQPLIGFARQSPSFNTWFLRWFVVVSPPKSMIGTDSIWHGRTERWWIIGG